MRRFFVPPGTLSGREIALPPELARRLARVLRLKRGDRVVLARAAGCVPVSLGPRILRSETAGIVAAALVMHELGKLGD